MEASHSEMTMLPNQGQDRITMRCNVPFSMWQYYLQIIQNLKYFLNSLNGTFVIIVTQEIETDY